ncbi:MAG: tetratricopeptide repeat protein [Mariprofundus sp.]|nr:tetratricopeptide repeat protein [Mariprofundus sp.]
MRRPLVYPVAVVLLCALGFNGCASKEKQIAMEQSRVQEKQQINDSIEQLRANQIQFELMRQQQSGALNEIQDRIEKLENLYQSQQAQLKALSSRIDRSRHRSRGNKIMTKKNISPEQRAITGSDQIQHTTIVEGHSSGLPPASPKADKAALLEAEKNAYTAAYLAWKSGRYDEAASAFNKQLDLYSNGEYSDQAWYWLGETRFAQHDHYRALNAFKYVADHYPDSVKHAAALLKLGQISESQNHWQQSALYYRRLIRDHADSDLAEQARKALGRTQNNPDITPEN